MVTGTLAAIMALSAFASVPAAVSAKGEQQRFRWKDRTIKIAVSTSLSESSSNIKTNSDVIGAVRRSIAAWQAVADIELHLGTSERQSVSAAGPAGDRVSLITIAQTPENVLLFSKNPQSESAKTRVFYNRIGFITEADIVLNPFQQFSTDGTFGTFDLESTITHELGHLLGLRHSAVLGSTMSDRTARNGSFGAADFGTRLLSESDISAVRDIYGPAPDDETCCAEIEGKLGFPPNRALELVVWAEESYTGRVMAQVDVSSDGSFRMGGLSAGPYNLYWQRRDKPAAGMIGELGTVELVNGETSFLTEKIVFRQPALALDYVGLNSQLADSAVSLSAGRSYVLYVGGTQIDPGSVTVNFNSPYLNVDQNSQEREDFGDGISAVRFTTMVDQDAPAGVYNIFATGKDGDRATLIGAITVIR